jgi:molybdenum cofactor biosynthesis enzyme MoaA
MKIQTFSIIAGSNACNARCPFCVSKMTPLQGVVDSEPEVNWRNLGIAARLARRCGVTTVMITGKGEPTLFPEQISKFLRELKQFEFPFVELQTNGILLLEHKERMSPFLTQWHGFGLTTVAVSIVHFDPERNREVYLPHRKSYMDLPTLIDHLHQHGLSVRLAVTLARGFVDDEQGIADLISYAREHQVEQLTVRPVNRPEASRDSHAADWAIEHHLSRECINSIRNYLNSRGHLLMNLAHGATVYDVEGQNICLSDSLTLEPSGDIRQLIFFPDGHLRYDWQHKGAILL